MFQVYNIIIQHLYTVQCADHQRSNSKMFVEHLIYVFIVYLLPKARNTVVIESMSSNSRDTQSHEEVIYKTKA